MSENTPQAKGPATVQLTPETTELALIPADQVNPEDLGTLSLRYVDGVAQLVVSGGRAIPQTIAIVDYSGAPVAAYSAGALSAESRNAYSGVAGAAALALIPGLDQGR
ncbi:hypothetical protein ACWC98_21670 [Streptomyces goshikiensis]|uniref:hypothetical protein n=1 Tax=Kitasatospora sp. MMS16-BH015 TaxID=2018025 RepID=UPI000CA312EE|nr:hypothetical protein [Kitasatospora sp. MMS16-BH015]AUG78880.1 hypothetical protein CFP65_4123 [Kitasatospora sp. MMS16-BH015]